MPEEENDGEYIENRNNDYEYEEEFKSQKNDVESIQKLQQTQKNESFPKERLKFDDVFDINGVANTSLNENTIIHMSNIDNFEYENQLMEEYYNFYKLKYENNDNIKKLLNFIKTIDNDNNIKKIPLKISFDEFIDYALYENDENYIKSQSGKDLLRNEVYLNDELFKKKYNDKEKNINEINENKELENETKVYNFFNDKINELIEQNLILKKKIMEKYNSKENIDPIKKCLMNVNILSHQTIINRINDYFILFFKELLDKYTILNKFFPYEFNPQLNLNNFITINNETFQMNRILYRYFYVMKNEENDIFLDNSYDKSTYDDNLYLVGYYCLHLSVDFLKDEAFINLLSFKNYDKNNIHNDIEINKSTKIKQFFKENPKTSAASSLVALGMLSVIPYTLITLLGGKTIKKRRKYLNKLKSRKIKKNNKKYKNKYLNKFKTRKNQKKQKNKYSNKFKSKKIKK